MNDYKDDDPGVDHSLGYQLEIAFYVAISVIFLMIIALMVKLLWDWDEVDGGGGGGGGRASERSGLLGSKVEGWFISYGTSDHHQEEEEEEEEEEDDVEKGRRRRRRRRRSTACNDDDLYDGKLCVICFDDQRSCLFMPCGHCITCYNCAKRIVSEEIKSCPICRTYIDKVRKLHIL